METKTKQVLLGALFAYSIGIFINSNINFMLWDPVLKTIISVFFTLWVLIAVNSKFKF